MNFKKIVLVLGSIITLGVLLVMANNSIWKFHSEPDVKTFYNRAVTYSNNLSFADFDQNEYLPGSLFFLVFPILFNNAITYDNYLNNIIFINLLLLATHLIIYKKIGNSHLTFLPIVLFIALGPILFFRFELFVSLIFIIGAYLFIKNKFLVSGIFIGMAIMIKVYPLLILPYLIILLLKNKQFSYIFKLLIGAIIGVLIPITIYVVLGGNVKDPINNLIYHIEKPIGVESIHSSIVSFKTLATTNNLPHIDVINGIWGIPETAKNIIVDFLPYIILIATYSVLLFTIKKESTFTFYIPIFIVLIFLMFSKYLNPQYLFWFFGLIPLVNIKKNITNTILILNMILILLITQLTFPIYFTNLLESYNSGIPNNTFYLLQIRNFLLIVEIILLYLSYKASTNNEGNSTYLP